MIVVLVPLMLFAYASKDTSFGSMIKRSLLPFMTVSDSKNLKPSLMRLRQNGLFPGGVSEVSESAAHKARRASSS
jgi:hypothetical protein